MALLRRFPVGFPAVRMARTGPLSAAFIGWSGPLGVASIYYLAHAHRYGVARYEQLFLAGSLAITASVLTQAMVASSAVRRYRHATGVEAGEGAELTMPGGLP